MTPDALPLVSEREALRARRCVVSAQIQLVQAPAVRAVIENVDVAAERAGGQAEGGVERGSRRALCQVHVVENKARDVGSVVVIVVLVRGEQPDSPGRPCGQLDIEVAAHDQRVRRCLGQTQRQRGVAQERVVLRAAPVRSGHAEPRVRRDAVAAGEIDLVELVARGARRGRRPGAIRGIVPGDGFDSVEEHRAVVADVEEALVGGIVEARLVLIGLGVDRLRKDDGVLLNRGRDGPKGLRPVAPLLPHVCRELPVPRQVHAEAAAPTQALRVQVVALEVGNVRTEDCNDLRALCRGRRHHGAGRRKGACQSGNRRQRPIIEVRRVRLRHRGLEPVQGQVQCVATGSEVRSLVAIGNVVAQLVETQVDAKFALLAVIEAQLASSYSQICPANVPAPDRV